MKVYEIVIKIFPTKGGIEPYTQAQYWSADNLAFASQAAAEYKPIMAGSEDLLEVVSVKFILEVTKSVDEVSDDTTD